MARNDRQLDPPLTDEAQDLLFDYFKHLSTLNVAFVAVVLALYDATEGKVGAIVSLIAFGVSLIVSLDGMSALINFKRWPMARPNTALSLTKRVAAAAFVGGVTGFAGGTFGVLRPRRPGTLFTEMPGRGPTASVRW